jgi:hypothetical protein
MSTLSPIAARVLDLRFVVAAACVICSLALGAGPA